MYNNNKGKLSGVPFRAVEALITIAIILILFTVISFIVMIKTVSETAVFTCMIGLGITIVYIIAINIYFAITSGMSFAEYVSSDKFF